MKKQLITLCVAQALLALPALAQESSGPSDSEGEQMSLEEISRMLDKTRSGISGSSSWRTTWPASRASLRTIGRL